jgi:acetyl esterase/lipase
VTNDGRIVSTIVGAPEFERANAPFFDEELARILPELHEITRPDFLRPENIDDFRALVDTWPLPALDDLERDGTFHVEQVVASDTDGAQVPMLVCVPRERLENVCPVIYFVHGGGMVVGNSSLGLDEVLDHATALNAAVVSVDYRLAPEFPHPVPVGDCYTGFQWIGRNGAEHGIDANRIIVYGESAGGGLAAALSLMVRDLGGPAPAGLLLVAPMLDDRNETLSSYQMAGLGIWDRSSNQTGWDALLGDARDRSDVSPYCSPSRAANLGGLPPTFLDCGSAETFRDEIAAFASRIWADGGSAELHVWPGGFHAFHLDAPSARLSIAAVAARRSWLERTLTSH